MKQSFEPHPSADQGTATSDETTKFMDNKKGEEFNASNENRVAMCYEASKNWVEESGKGIFRNRWRACALARFACGFDPMESF